MEILQKETELMARLGNSGYEYCTIVPVKIAADIGTPFAWQPANLTPEGLQPFGPMREPEEDVDYIKIYTALGEELAKDGWEFLPVARRSLLHDKWPIRWQYLRRPVEVNPYPEWEFALEYTRKKNQKPGILGALLTVWYKDVKGLLTFTSQGLVEVAYSESYKRDLAGDHEEKKKKFKSKLRQEGWMEIYDWDGDFRSEPGIGEVMSSRDKYWVRKIDRS